MKIRKVARSDELDQYAERENLTSTPDRNPRLHPGFAGCGVVCESCSADCSGMRFFLHDRTTKRMKPGEVLKTESF